MLVFGIIFMSFIFVFQILLTPIMVVGAISVSAQTQTEYEEVRAKIESYEKLSLVNEYGKSIMKIGADKNIIRRGDTVRYKVIWDLHAYKIQQFFVEGVGETTPEDLRNGKFEVVLKPDKTTTYKSGYKYIGYQDRSYEKVSEFTIVVLEPEKYDSVMQLRSLMNNQQRGIQFRELKGEKVDPWEKEIINKMAKMSPKERREYEKKLEKKFGGKRK